MNQKIGPTFASLCRKSIVSWLTLVAICSFNSHLTETLPSVSVTSWICTSIHITLAFNTSLLWINIPIAWLASITPPSINMRMALALSCLVITDTINRTADMTIAPWKYKKTAKLNIQTETSNNIGIIKNIKILSGK